MIKFRKIKISLCLVLIMIGVLSLSLLKSAHANDLSSFDNENFTYAIRKFGLKGGESSLSFRGVEKLNGRDVYLIVFTAKALNFYDEEKIYVDMDTFYPLVVERDLNIWGSKEKIVEEYLEDEGVVRIRKEAKGQTTEQIIRKDERIDNLYCFIYRFRMNKRSKIGQSMVMNLPTKDVTIKVIKKTKVKAAGAKHDAFYLESQPKEYKVWFDLSDEMLPLRIDAGTGMGATSMVLTKPKG